MQKVTLEIESPYLDHRHCWLRNEQIFQVGASALMDLGIPGDHYLNEHHFSIQIHQGRCAILDNGTVNGTWVNGKKIECTWLRDGDVIHAGQSTFRLRIAGPVPASSQADLPLPATASTSQPLVDHQWSWRAEEISDENFVCTPVDADDYSIHDLIQSLPSDLQPYLLVDRQQLGWNVERSHPYLNGSPELMPFLSLYAPRDRSQFIEKVEPLCEKRRRVVVLSRLPFDQLVRQLHPNATSYSSSTLFSAQIHRSPAAFTHRLLEGLEGVIWLDANQKWQLAMHADPDVQWQRLAMQRSPRDVTRLQRDDETGSDEQESKGLEFAQSA